MDAETLKELILAQYTSIHAFCRAHAELKRSTVYMVLAGRYPGRQASQLISIHRALEGAKEHSPPSILTVPSAKDLSNTLQNIRCKHCRTLDKRRCMECRMQTTREAEELQAYLGRTHEQDTY